MTEAWDLQWPSIAALPLELSVRRAQLAFATGFTVANSSNELFLITNRHVVTGRHQDTNRPMSTSAATPDSLRVRLPVHHSQGFSWHETACVLFDPVGAPLWLEHPILGKRADVVGLRLRSDLVQPAMPVVFDVSKDEVDAMTVTTAVSIIGFPLGRRAASGLPIWMRGHVASEPSFDYDGLPTFLVDARTRQGQSGSPVIEFYPPGAAPDNRHRGPVIMVSPHVVVRMHGIYSARIDNRDLDVGLVWRNDCIREVIENGVAPAEPTHTWE